MTTTRSTLVHLAFFLFLLPSPFSCSPKKQKGAVIKKNILTAGVHQFIPSWVLSIAALNFQILFFVFSLLKSVPSLSLNSDGKSLHEQQKKKVDALATEMMFNFLIDSRSLSGSFDWKKFDRWQSRNPLRHSRFERRQPVYQHYIGLFKIWLKSETPSINALQFNNYLHLWNPQKFLKRTCFTHSSVALSGK